MQSVSIVKEDFDENLEKIGKMTDTFEGYSHPHSSRIAVLADAAAKIFNMASHDRHALRQAALIHDIGELVMNREYIKVSRILTEQEHVDMQRHPVIGEQETAKRGLSRAVQLLVRWHHEWWNGAGYPDALAPRTNSACRQNLARRRHLRRSDRCATLQSGDSRNRSETLSDRMGWNRIRSGGRQSLFVFGKSAGTRILRQIRKRILSEEFKLRRKGKGAK